MTRQSSNLNTLYQYTVFGFISKSHFQFLPAHYDIIVIDVDSRIAYSREATYYQREVIRVNRLRKLDT